MTKERGQDLVIVAVVISVLLHVGVMLFVRTKVMTQGAGQGLYATHRDPVRLREFVPPDDPVRMAKIKDILAAKAAPAAAKDDPLLPQGPAERSLPLAQPDFKKTPPPAPPSAPTVEPLETRALERARAQNQTPPSSVPVSYDLPKSRRLTAPVRASPAALPLPAFFGTGKPVQDPVIPEIRLGTERFGSAPAAETAFVPTAEVLKEVDERLVATEKAAVRALLRDAAAADLTSAVMVETTAAADESWVYFQTCVTPRAMLPVVPKDVVILLDASGSLGSDRLVSCRLAAKKLMRTVMNSGDRFNLVAFRNRFDYAFTRWQSCTADSFEQADRWLARLTAHGRTDVFATIRSVLTLPRDPARPLIALVVTDGEANTGVSETAEILSRFTALNDGLVSVYMYGVNRGANRELIDVLTHGNRGESFVFEGVAWRAGSGIEALSERFRDPVLSDLRMVFTAESKAEAYPRLVKNLYQGNAVVVTGRVPRGTKTLTFSLSGLNGKRAYEGLFTVDLEKAAKDPTLAAAWAAEREIDRKLR